MSKIDLDDRKSIYINCKSFIQSNIHSYDDLKKNVKEIEKLFLYFEQIGYNPDVDFIAHLFNDCIELKNIFRSIMHFHSSVVLKNESSQFLKHRLFNMFLDTLCMEFYSEICDDIDTSMFPEKNVDAEYTDNSLNLYFHQIQLPLLSAEEERLLVMKMKNGDERAKQILIERNLRLVVFIARRYIGKGLSFDDLIQEGNLGLIKSLEMYDISYGTKFSTYAYRGIASFILRAIENCGRNVRLPVHVSYKVSQYNRAYYELFNRFHRNATISEIADYLKITEDEVWKLRGYVHDTVSISSLIKDENIELGETLSDDTVDVENTVISDIMRSELVQLLYDCDLSDREIDILFARNGFYNGVIYTYHAISSKYHISKQAIQSAERRALNKIRACDKIDDFVIYLNNSSKCLKKIQAYRKTLVKGRNYYNDIEISS